MAFLFGSPGGGTNKGDYYYSEDEEDVVDEYDDFLSPNKKQSQSTAPPDEGWFDLHNTVCRESCSLTATPKEVLEWSSRQLDSNERLVPTRPDVSECMQWPTASDAQETKLIETLVEQIQNPPSLSETATSSWYGYFKSFWGSSKENDDEEEWEQTADEYVMTETKLVGFDAPVLNIEMTLAMANEVQKAIRQLEEPLVVPEFINWCRSQQEEEEQEMQWSSLPDSQLELLLRVLKQLQDVAVVDDAIILGCSASLSQAQREALVTLDRIRTAVASTEEQLEQWRQNRTDLMKQASTAVSTAKRARLLQRVKLLDQHISTAEARFTNLLQTQHALESASSTSATVEVLKESTAVWKSLQEETTVERVTEVIDDLQDELEQVQERNDVISGASGTSAQPVDEDDLLRELEALTITSDDTGDVKKADPRDEQPSALANEGSEKQPKVKRDDVSDELANEQARTSVDLSSNLVET